MENTQYNNLETKFDGLEGKFNGLDGKFNGLNNKFDKLSTKFDELIEFLTIQFGKVEQKFEKVDKRLTSLENGQDKVWHEVLGIRQDNRVSAYRSSRMETWITKAAKRIDLPYNP